MNTSHRPPGTNKTLHTALPLFPGLRNSLHLKALSEFFLTAKRADARKLFITVLLALLLAIPATALILANGLNNASDNLKQARRISVFMAPGTPQPVVTQLSHMLITNDYISTATPIPAHTEKPVSVMPLVVEVIPAATLDTQSVIELADQLRALAGVDFVELNVARLDQTASAYDLLGRFARIANAAALLVAALLMLAVSYHDIRKSRATIKLMKQLGGTLTDVRRPYLYRGPTLGLIAATLGIAVAIAIIWISSSFVDISSYKALIPIRPSLGQAIMFFLIVMIASLAATIRIFSKLFTVYNQ